MIYNILGRIRIEHGMITTLCAICGEPLPTAEPVTLRPPMDVLRNHNVTLWDLDHPPIYCERCAPPPTPCLN